MRILYATTNPAKLSAMKKHLDCFGIELISLKDVSGNIPTVTEDGDTPLENASKKAFAYYEAFKTPVFSCDSGLYFENLPELSPMTHVRNINGIRLSDEQMIEHYSYLARKHGDIIARYKNAVCFIYDENHIFRDDGDDLGGNRFIITSVPHEKREKGFPLDCLSKRIGSGEYYYDSPDEDVVDMMDGGFKRFFSYALTALKSQNLSSQGACTDLRSKFCR